MESATFLLRISLCLLLFFSLCSKSEVAAEKDLVQSSCAHASYPTVCVKTLSAYAGTAETPGELAGAAVNVSLGRARKLSGYLSMAAAGLRSGSKRVRAAVRDCSEQMSDTVDELRRTLGELKQVANGGAGSGQFRWHMSNAETWVSAALTNEDTCLDGFDGVDGKVKADVKRRINNVARVTSNALYLINRLDDAHP
ncbi:pectinesterase inhibitor 3 [Malania oleifera]|uniref:pectinesterase inhibitor 3 n=1 Tax=Malania oleifera TaxID=397392 RepID=UPI0025AEC236|nr:pectinesterase inhibitor 3 [Malania oleifera]